MARAVTLHEMEPVDRLPVHELRRPAKTSGPVDGRGHAMFGRRMEEEAKVQSIITANWQREDGSITTTQFGPLDRGSCRSVVDVGLQLADAKRILGRLQEIVLAENNCNGTAKLCGRVLAVIVGATCRPVLKS